MAVDLVSLFVVIVVLGLVWYLVTTYIPMPPGVRTVITVVAVLILCLWLLHVFGVSSIVVPVRR